jgi:predicted SAM-dependent methyltransferase
MISRTSKAAFFALATPVMRCNGAFYRRFRAPVAGTSRVHLGPGRDNYLQGWINVDANVFTGRADVWADLRGPLPFRDESIDVFYSHHVIEHLPDSTLPFHMGEMYRCLKKGGGIRIGGPDADEAMRQYLANDTEWFSSWPDARRSVGGRFANFILCRGEHLTILTESYLRELLEDAGFVNIQRRRPGLDTGLAPWIDEAVLVKEPEPTPAAPHTLLVEARKPRDAGF